MGRGRDRAGQMAAPQQPGLGSRFQDLPLVRGLS